MAEQGRVASQRSRAGGRAIRSLLFGVGASDRITTPS
jgi:hypothetical protein